MKKLSLLALAFLLSASPAFANVSVSPTSISALSDSVDITGDGEPITLFDPSGAPAPSYTEQSPNGTVNSTWNDITGGDDTSGSWHFVMYNAFDEPTALACGAEGNYTDCIAQQIFNSVEMTVSIEPPPAPSSWQPSIVVTPDLDAALSAATNSADPFFSYFWQPVLLITGLSVGAILLLYFINAIKASVYKTTGTGRGGNSITHTRDYSKRWKYKGGYSRYQVGGRFSYKKRK